MGKGCTPICRDGGWQAVPETSRNGDCARVKVSCGENADEGGEGGPDHREMAGGGLAEALIKLSLNELNKGGRPVLLYLCLCSET